jgi:hypothetical protein
MGQKSFIDRDYNSVSEAHFIVLQQLEIAAPYIEEHLSELRGDNIGRTEAWIMKEHRCVFTTWLTNKEIPTEDMTMKMLASHPSSCVTSWQAYNINEYTYYTKEKDKKSVAQIVAFASRLLIHKDWKPRTMGTYRTYGNSITI